MKTCPYCLSEVSERAVKCNRCGEWVDKNTSSTFNKTVKGIKGSIWRLITVLYIFVSIPILLVEFGWVWNEYAYYDEWGQTIILFILIPIIYLIITDILRGAVYYITTGKYELYIWEKIKPFIKKILNGF